MKPILLMRHTLAYIVSQAESGNQVAIDFMTKAEGMDIVKKEMYLVLTDRIIVE